MNRSIASGRDTAPEPGMLSPLVGRDREIARLRELLDDPAIRLVTITGPGGVGKTSLANVLATSLADSFGDAITTVALAAIRDSALVLPAIAQELGIFSDPQDAPEDHLASLLGNEPALLVLDNMEQVHGAAPVLANMLGRCPRVTVLVTSRAPLGVSGEQLFPLAPLPSPAAGETDTSEILRSDAVSLFARRARAKRPDFVVTEDNAPTIAAICRRLDGLPLAIELAAARTTILSPAALLARLTNRLTVLGGGRQDAPDRQRTMRDAIAWSHDLLAPEEQALFRRLAVFQGGFSLDAVEFVARQVPTDRETLDILEALVDHSLVQLIPACDEPRYQMLETLRDFGWEQLAATCEEHAARLAHATWVVGLAELNVTIPIEQRVATWVNRFDPEIENIRAAVEWTLDHGHADLAMRAAASIWNYCINRALASECRIWLDRAIAACGHQAAPRRRLEAAYAAGCLAEYQGVPHVARNHLERGLALAIELGHVEYQIGHLGVLGVIAKNLGQYDEARDLNTRSAELARQAGDTRGVAKAHANMGSIAFYQGNLEDAARYFEESAATFTELGDLRIAALVTSNIGSVVLEQGDLERAEAILGTALADKRRNQTSQDLPDTLINLAVIWRLRGESDRALEALDEAIELSREYGNRIKEAEGLVALARVKAGEDALAAATLVLAATCVADEARDRATLIDCAECLALICTTRGNAPAASELLAASASARATLRTTVLPRQAAELAAVESAVRSQLDNATYIAARERGDRLDFDELTRRIGIIAREIVGPQVRVIDGSDPPGAPDTAGAPPAHDLTTREMEVLQLLANGRSTQEIADALYITPRTAGTHISNMLGKLGVTSRTAAVAYALRERLV